MSTRKADLDIQREDIAREVSGTLIGTGISVSGGGGNGPCQVTASRPSRGRMGAVVEAIEAALGFTEDGPGA